MIDINPHEIRPLHGVQRQRLCDELVEDMRENGWRDRPLLVIEREGGEYVAWTGSHRIAAARQAGLPTVPCCVLEERELLRHGIDADYCVEDWERRKFCVMTGDDDAIRTMWLEGRS